MRSKNSIRPHGLNSFGKPLILMNIEKAGASNIYRGFSFLFHENDGKVP
jgi:hypothetical protein